MQNHMVRMDAMKPAGDFLTGRVPLAANSDIVYSVVKPHAQLPAYYRNGYCDEMVVIAKGSGRVRTVFGSIDFGPLDFVCIPRGVTSSWQFDADSEQQYVVLESRTAIRPPCGSGARAASSWSSSPTSERDLRVPQWVEPESQTGEFPVLVKAGEHLVRLWFDRHPFDAVGWDGFDLSVRAQHAGFQSHDRTGASDARRPTGLRDNGRRDLLLLAGPHGGPSRSTPGPSAPYEHGLRRDFYRILDENDVAQTRPETGVGTITLHCGCSIMARSPATRAPLAGRGAHCSA